MADDRQKKRGKQPPEPEPEGGPDARREEFIQERLTPLRPRSPEPPEAEGIAPAPADEEERAEISPDFRASRVADYRARQKKQLQKNKKEKKQEQGRRRGSSADPDQSETAEEDNLGEGPPLPPAPPPANNWIPIGPSVLRQGQGGTLPPVSGRVLGFAIAPGGDRVYAATSNGGVWRSDNAGVSWRSLMDAWDLNPTTRASDSLSCGAIAIDPSNPDRVFVGSGDGDEAMFLGVGPVVSFDGGTNWATEPVAPGSPQLAGSAFFALAVDPGNTNRVVGATVRGLYRRESDGAGGFRWARKATPAGVIGTVVVARTGGVTTFFAAPLNGPVFRSANGNTWNVVGTGFPAVNVSRVGLAVQPTNPNVLYALVAASDWSLLGVYRLDNSTGAWRQITGAPTDLFGTAVIGFQGGYDLAIAVDPTNANLIYLGGSTRISNGAWSGSSFRCTIASSGSGAGLTYNMTPTYIGNSHHADAHALAFAPGDSNKLWLGCDGGAFYSTNPTGAGDVFVPRNTGLQTLEMNHLGQHPTEDAVVFCGTQDNGGTRFTGEEAWYHSVWGDSGFLVVNWNDPYRVLATYVGARINRTTDGGSRYNYAPVNVSLPAADSARFYAPLVGTPPSGTPAQAERVAFGSQRPWISDTFGGGWQSIPANGATDDLGSQIRSLVFASHTKLYAGTTGGGVYRFDQGAGGAWTRTRLDTLGGTNVLGVVGMITDIAVDPFDATRNSIYVCFGGAGDWRHVWRFDGSQWQQRSGPAAGNIASLLDVQHNALVCDPANAGTVFVGADIGIWRSTDSGQNWAPFSSGLPDAPVLDLLLHNPRRLLRASTYGRSVYEYDLATASAAGVQLYVRDTQLDQGRFTTVNGLPDPTDQGEFVRHWAGPDIKLDTPDASGNYQFPTTPGTTIDFEEFVNDLTDDFRNVATHATATVTTRVYVQVHNRGVTPANNVRVMLLLANASAGLPNLPAGFAMNVQTGTPISTATWRTVGFARLDDVRVGFPQIAAFDLPSSLLPPPASLAGNDHHCVLALVHHASDPFTSAQIVTDDLSRSERKAAHKNLKVVQFTGALPPKGEPPAVLPVQINGIGRRLASTTLIIVFKGYRGRVRLWLPKLPTRGGLLRGVEGAKRVEPGNALTWAKQHIEDIFRNQESGQPYDREWSRRRVEDVEAVLDSGLMLVGDGRRGRITIKNLALKPGTQGTMFLLFDRPRETKPGTWFPVEVIQLDSKTNRVLGGLSARVEVVPPPRAQPVVTRARATPLVLDIPELITSA